MSLQRFIVLAVISIIINLASLLNAGFALWSVVILIFAIFQFKFRDANRPASDKKTYGFIQISMLGVLIFLSAGVGLGASFGFGLFIYDRFPQFFIIGLIAGVIGLVLYYYLVICLMKEALAIFRQGKQAR